MPELPEVETIKRGLKKTIVGQVIESVEVRLPKIVSLGPAVVSNLRSSHLRKKFLFQKLLRHRKIRQIQRRAKMLLIRLSAGYTLLVHLKMTGQLMFVPAGERKRVKLFNAPHSRTAVLPHQYTHVIFRFRSGAHLYFNDLRQFGYLRLVRDDELPKVRELQEYGPEPLSATFALAQFVASAQRRPRLTIKQYLMDPTVVAGIGNIYSDEILYRAKIRPTRRLRSLARADWQAIYRNIPKVLKQAVRAQGSSVGDFFKVDGSEGRFGREHMVYGRSGEICYNCGETIQKVKLGGRTASYCPACQR